MPTYEYECSQCGDFTALRRMQERDEPCACPNCGRLAIRALLTAPAFAGMESHTRQAHSRNERAAHEPKQTSKGHEAGCSCCSASSHKTKTVQGADGAKAFPTSRPWMISH